MLRIDDDAHAWRQQVLVATNLHYDNCLERFSVAALAWATEQSLHVEGSGHLAAYYESLKKVQDGPGQHVKPFVPAHWRRHAAMLLELKFQEAPVKNNSIHPVTREVPAGSFTAAQRKAAAKSSPRFHRPSRHSLRV